MVRMLDRCVVCLRQVYGIQALPDNDFNKTTKNFYQELAVASGGQYLNLGHFDLITDMFRAGRQP